MTRRRRRRERSTGAGAGRVAARRGLSGRGRLPGGDASLRGRSARAGGGGRAGVVLCTSCSSAGAARRRRDDAVTGPARRTFSLQQSGAGPRRVRALPAPTEFPGGTGGSGGAGSAAGGTGVKACSGPRARVARGSGGGRGAARRGTARAGGGLVSGSCERSTRWLGSRASALGRRGRCLPGCSTGELDDTSLICIPDSSATPLTTDAGGSSGTAVVGGGAQPQTVAVSPSTSSNTSLNVFTMVRFASRRAMNRDSAGFP